MANTLQTLGERESNLDLVEYSVRLKVALIDTVGAGIITGDLKGKTLNPASEQVVDMFGFLDSVESRL